MSNDNETIQGTTKEIAAKLKMDYLTLNNFLRHLKKVGDPSLQEIGKGEKPKKGRTPTIYRMPLKFSVSLTDYEKK